MDNGIEVTAGGYELQELFELQEQDALNAILPSRLLATPAYILGEFLSQLEVPQTRSLLRLIPLEQAAEAVSEMDSHFAAQVVEAMRDVRAVSILEELDPDDAADIFGEMDSGDRERLLRRVDPALSRIIRRLITYPADSAGGIMNPQVATVLPSMTVAQTVRLVQKLSQQIEHIHYVYVTESDQKLVGVVSMRALVLARSTQQIAEIMVLNPVSVTVERDQEEVAQLVAQRNLNSLPVVDQQNRLLGIITHDDIVDVIREEATEDIQKLMGAAGDESIMDAIPQSIRRRLPWLLINLGTASLAGIVISLFQHLLSEKTLLAAFMPIVANLGGNTGGQTLAIVIRSLALDEIHSTQTLSILLSETIKGFFNGLFIGLCAAIIIGGFQHSIALLLVVWVSMVLTMTYAGAAGALIPIVIKRLNLDPAQSSSIFVTATTDIFAFTVFLGIANATLS